MWEPHSSLPREMLGAESSFQIMWLCARGWGLLCKSVSAFPVHFSVGDMGILSFTSVWEGNGNPLQCSYVKNPRDWEPGGLLSMGLHRVGHDWSDLAAAAAAAGVAQLVSRSLAERIPWCVAIDEYVQYPWEEGSSGDSYVSILYWNPFNGFNNLDIYYRDHKDSFFSFRILFLSHFLFFCSSCSSLNPFLFSNDWFSSS